MYLHCCIFSRGLYVVSISLFQSIEPDAPTGSRRVNFTVTLLDLIHLPSIMDDAFEVPTAQPSKPTNDEADAVQSEDEDDGGPDWTKLPYERCHALAMRNED